MKFMKNHHRVDRRGYPDWETPSTLDFAEEFLGLSWEDVRTLPKEKYDVLMELKGHLMDFSEEVLERICADGMGESFDEMCANAAVSVIVPKLVREYAERKDNCPWEEAVYMYQLCPEWFYEAYEEKYGPLYPDW